VLRDREDARNSAMSMEPSFRGDHRRAAAIVMILVYLTTDYISLL